MQDCPLIRFQNHIIVIMINVRYMNQLKRIIPCRRKAKGESKNLHSCNASDRIEPSYLKSKQVP